jgi:Arc/MetJ-type ribon-helix-helix transcriptional regulator
MSQVKLSVSLSDGDVAALDRYARAAGLKSRSAAIQQAIRLLGDPDLEAAYAAVWQEWETSGDAEAWESTAADGLADAPR